VRIDALVEGQTDEAVARRITRDVGHEFGFCFGKRGCTYIQSKVRGFSRRNGPCLLALVDFMDFDFPCPSALVNSWLPDKSDRTLLRVVVRELESWFLADKRGLASFLHVSPVLIPNNPEELRDPKQFLINLARRSRKASIRRALVPAEGSSASVGPGYVAEIETFVANTWDLAAARTNSLSLNRCLLRLEEMI
jgi:hypothetical protein